MSVWRTRQQGSKTHGLELVEPVRLLVEEGRVLSPVLPLELRVRQGPRRDVQVVDAASRPMAGARVTIVSLQGRVSPFGAAVLTGPAGDAVLVGGEAGAHDLLVAIPGRGWSVERDIEIPGDGPLTVALPVPGRVRIQEPGSWRLGPPGLPWWVRDSAHRWLGMVTEITDGIEWLVPPGRWVVSDGGERQWSLEVDSGELSLLPPVADEEGP